MDLSYGNSPSTVRHFKRVSSCDKAAPSALGPPKNPFQPNPNAQTFRPTPPASTRTNEMNDENEPPEPDYPPMPVTKDALYGRRAYSKVLDGVFQEAHADSASRHQREAMSKLAQAWEHLDQVDPHGEFILLKSMIERLQTDPKLASALGIAVPTPQNPHHPGHDTRTSDTSLGGTTVHGTATTRMRANTTSTDGRPSTAMSTASAASSAHLQSPLSTPASPLKGAKLVLAQNNPHLKSHRRRQSAFVGGEKMWGAEKNGFADIDEKKLPGHVERGMEQQGVIADILYGQWIAGLKNRWAQS